MHMSKILNEASSIDPDELPTKLRVFLKANGLDDINGAWEGIHGYIVIVKTGRIYKKDFKELFNTPFIRWIEPSDRGLLTIGLE